MLLFRNSPTGMKLQAFKCRNQWRIFMRVFGSLTQLSLSWHRLLLDLERPPRF